MTELRTFADRFGLCAKVRGVRRRIQGSVAVEYGLVLPALLLLLFLIIDAGRLLWTQTTLDRAVEAAARCGAIDAIDCGSAVQVQNYAVAQAYGITVDASAFTPVAASCGMQVNANFTFSPSIPLLGSGTILLTATACYPKPAT